VAQGNVVLTPAAQVGLHGQIVAAKKIVVPLSATGTVSQVVANLSQLPQLEVSEQILGAPTYAYTVTPPIARTDTVTNTQGTSLITDAAIASGDSGKAVAGTGVPIVSYVGTVTPGASFTLVDGNGNAVVTTAAVTSIVVGAVDLTTIARSPAPAGAGATYVTAASVGAIGGPAGPLDGGGKVPAAQIPAVAAGVQSVTAGNGTVTVGGTVSNPTVAVGTGIPESAITNLTTDLAAKAPLVVVRSQYVTSGDVTLPNTAGGWQRLLESDGTTPFELDVPASSGHWVELGVHAMRSNTSTAFLDVAVMVGSSIVYYLSTGSSTAPLEGDPGFYFSNAFTGQSAPRGVSVASGLLDGGNVRFIIAVKAIGSGTLYASGAGTGYPFYWQAKNLGPHG
jgi:hypothetical protein